MYKILLYHYPPSFSQCLKIPNSSNTRKNQIGFVICLENGPSFGKSQLLNAPTLANQNKNKKARDFQTLWILYYY